MFSRAAPADGGVEVAVAEAPTAGVEHADPASASGEGGGRPQEMGGHGPAATERMATAAPAGESGAPLRASASLTPVPRRQAIVGGVGHAAAQGLATPAPTSQIGAPRGASSQCGAASETLPTSQSQRQPYHRIEGGTVGDGEAVATSPPIGGGEAALARILFSPGHGELVPVARRVTTSFIDIVDCESKGAENDARGDAGRSASTLAAPIVAASALGSAGAASDSPENCRGPAEVAQEPPRPCVFCRQDMEQGQTLQALPCMHLFHSACLQEYAGVKNLPWQECCPYRCSVGAGGAEDLTRDAGGSEEDAAEPPQSIDADLLRLAAEADAAASALSE